MSKRTNSIKITATAFCMGMAVLFAGCGGDGKAGGQQTAAEEEGGSGTAGAGEETGSKATEAGEETGSKPAEAGEENNGAAGGAGSAASTKEYGKDAYLAGIKAADYVKPGEYKGVEVKADQPEVTDERMDSYIEDMLCINPDRGVIEGDTVNIDYAGTLDGVAFDGGTAAGQDLGIGSGQFVPGFEDGLIGAEVGETVEVPLTFPENYHEELAGKDVVFTVTINSITAAEPQELTDEFVKRLDIGLGTVEEYRQYVYDTLYEEASAAYEQQVEDAAMTAVFAQCEFTAEPPQAMVDRHVDTLISNLTSQAAAYGLSLPQLMEVYGMDEEAYMKEFRTEAVEYAKQQIMIKAIADAEGLQVTEEEFRQELEKLAQLSGGTAEGIESTMDTEGYKEYLLSLKVLKLLGENASVSEAQGSGESVGNGE